MRKEKDEWWLMELSDTELNYINFGDETHSDNGINNSVEDFVF